MLIFNYGDSYQSDVLDVTQKYYVKNLIVFGDLPNSTKIGLVDSLKSSDIVEFVDSNTYEFEDGEFYVSVFESESKTKAVRYDSQNYKILQVLYSVSETEIQNNAIFDDCFDCLIATHFVSRYTQIDANKYVAKRLYDAVENVDMIGDLWTTSI